MGITKMIRSIGKNKTTPRETGAAAKTIGVSAVLDHPQQGEIITAPQYTFRIGTLGNIELVDISINQGPWQPCRNAAGYWWYDWSGYKSGRYQAEAKAKTKDGRAVTSMQCNFQVALGTDMEQSRTSKRKP